MGQGRLRAQRRQARKNWPSLPFVAAVEIYVLRQLRGLGIPMRAVREAAQGIKDRLGDPYGLASPDLGVDGQEILVSIAEDYYCGADLQQAASETITDFKRVLSWDGRVPQRLRLVNLGGNIILDPRFGWGRPVIERTKVPVAALVGQWLGGDSLADIAYDFDMTASEVESVVQSYLNASQQHKTA